MKVYLAGPIEHSPDGGRGWRRLMARFVRESLGHEVYDPAEDERKSLSEEEWSQFRAWKCAQPRRFREVLRKIIDYDLAILEGVDYVICHWDQFAPSGGGTQGELTFARHRRIPVYLVRSVPLEQISGWVLGCSEEVFPSFEELGAFLLQRYVSAGPLQARTGH